jgi:hypothetical protein
MTNPDRFINNSGLYSTSPRGKRNGFRPNGSVNCLAHP